MSFSNDLGALKFHQRSVYLDWSCTSYKKGYNIRVRQLLILYLSKYYHHKNKNLVMQKRFQWWLCGTPPPPVDRTLQYDYLLWICKKCKQFYTKHQDQNAIEIMENSWICSGVCELIPLHVLSFFFYLHLLYFDNYWFIWSSYVWHIWQNMWNHSLSFHLLQFHLQGKIISEISKLSEHLHAVSCYTFTIT